MLPTHTRPILPTIRSTRGPVEDYWEGYAAVPGVLDDVLDPLDGLLVHLWVGATPKGVEVADLASAATDGATTALLLTHPSPRKIYALADGREELARWLQTFAHEFGRTPSLEFVPELQLVPSSRNGLVIVVDARAIPVSPLDEAIASWLTDRPDAVVLMLNSPPLGSGGPLDMLIPGRIKSGEWRVWFARDFAEPLAGSRLAVITVDTHPDVGDTIRRVGRAFTGNTRYVDLLWDLNEAAIRFTGADRKVFETNPSFAPTRREIDTAKLAASETRAELERCKIELELCKTELNRFWDEMGHHWNALMKSRSEHHHCRDELASALSFVERLEIESAQRAHEIAILHASFAYRSGRRIDRIRRWLFPDDGRRHRAARRVVGWVRSRFLLRSRLRSGTIHHHAECERNCI